jgi:hypothetical protein
MAVDNLQKAIDLVDELTDEEFHSLIDYIRSTVKSRAARKNAMAQARIKVGTRVRFEGPRKPQYLSGLTGVVEEKRQTRVLVKLDRGPVGKFRNGKVLTHAGGLGVMD